MAVPDPLIVIFGAKVESTGVPSAALRRRIQSGLEAARQFPLAPMLCTGGCAGTGPSEACVMAGALVAYGIEADRLILDESSQNTRENIAAAIRHVELAGSPFVIACSDPYHLPRVRMMLWLHGVSSRSGPVAAGLHPAPLRHRIVMSLRESLAIPAYLAIFLASRLGNRP